MLEVTQRLSERRSLELKWHNQQGKKKGLLESLILTQLWATRPWRKSWSLLSIRHFRSEKGTVGTEMRPAIDPGIVTSDTLWPNTMANTIYICLRTLYVGLTWSSNQCFSPEHSPRFLCEIRPSFLVFLSFELLWWIEFRLVPEVSLFLCLCSGMHRSETCEKSWHPEFQLCCPSAAYLKIIILRIKWGLSLSLKLKNPLFILISI